MIKLQIENTFIGQGYSFISLSIGDIDYYRDKEKLLNMTEELSRSDFVVEESVNSWYTSYMRWLKTDKAADVAWYYDVELDGSKYNMREILATSGLQLE